MTICFTLTMPNRGSWNGRWSGEGNLYAVIKKFRKTKENQERVAALLAQGGWYYRWSDGWGASIEVKEVDSAKARQIRKASRGFCGYEWMIDSILEHGKIYAGHEKPKLEMAAV